MTDCHHWLRFYGQFAGDPCELVVLLALFFHQFWKRTEDGTGVFRSQIQLLSSNELYQSRNGKTIKLTITKKKANTIYAKCTKCKHNSSILPNVSKRLKHIKLKTKLINKISLEFLPHNAKLVQCLSQACSTKMAKYHHTTNTTDNLRSQVFWHQRCWWNFNAVTPNMDAKYIRMVHKW